MTKQKKLIMDTLASTTCHPTADWIYQSVRKNIADISLGTVYRNLQVLKEEGKIQELNYGKNQSRYDGNPQLHYHFVCESCGCVLDFNLDNKAMLSLILPAAPGSVHTHRLEVYGICQDCLKKHF